MKKLFYKTTIFMLLMVASSALAQGETLKVVASIGPIHSLVAGVMQGVAEPELLVKGGGSPHGYMLRPSEARILARADLIIWVGPSLESFMEKYLRNLAGETRQLELMNTLAEYLLPMREGGSWEVHADDERGKESIHADGGHQQHPEDHGSHGEGEFNPHLWLSPLVAKEIVSATERVLVELDRANADIYRQNASQLNDRLDNLHDQLTAQLNPFKNVPYIVFHDAYPYFERAYGLSPAGSVTVDPERKPGARRISEIRSKIKNLNARCVFSEPQFEPRMVDVIIDGTGARKGILDPLGVELAADKDSYFSLLNNLADNLVTGLR